MNVELYGGKACKCSGITGTNKTSHRQPRREGRLAKRKKGFGRKSSTNHNKKNGEKQLKRLIFNGTNAFPPTNLRCIMGLRFRKSLSLLPGLKLNLSKSGPSVSVGGQGLSYNIGTKGSRETVGLPGSGLSYSETSSSKPGKKNSLFGIVVLIAAIAYAVFKNLR